MSEEGETGFFADLRREEENSAAASAFPRSGRWGVFAHDKADEFIEPDIRAGQARIGGTLRTPSYRESYLLAAQRLVDASRRDEDFDALAVPTMYCMVHTAELALKDLVRLAFDVRDEAASFQDRTSTGLPLRTERSSSVRTACTSC